MVYALSPVDLIPDFIPVLGYIDDILLLPILIALTLRFIPKEIMDQHRQAEVDLWKDGKPKKWYYGLPVLLFWGLLLYFLLRKFL